jgi:hypothetical protein
MATAGNISYAIKSTAAAIATALGHAQETNRKKPLVVGELSESNHVSLAAQCAVLARL